MRKPFFILFIVCCSIFISSCKSLENIDLQDIPILVKMEKGPNRNRMPMYSISIYNNKIAVYEGKRNTPKLGTWTKKLSESDWVNLKEHIKNSKLWEFPSFFKSQYLDMPLVTITQFEGEAFKVVAGKENRPPEVMSLEFTLESIANSGGWILKEAIDFGLAPNETPNQLKVQLKPGVYAGKWAYKYARQNMRVLAPLQDKSNYYLIGFDPTITFPKEMVRLLDFDDEVQFFEFNTISTIKRESKRN